MSPALLWLSQALATMAVFKPRPKVTLPANNHFKGRRSEIANITVIATCNTKAIAVRTSLC
jgi:hypothetical protein